MSSPWTPPPTPNSPVISGEAKSWFLSICSWTQATASWPHRKTPNLLSETSTCFKKKDYLTLLKGSATVALLFTFATLDILPLQTSVSHQLLDEFKKKNQACRVLSHKTSWTQMLWTRSWTNISKCQALLNSPSLLIKMHGKFGEQRIEKLQKGNTLFKNDILCFTRILTMC